MNSDFVKIWCEIVMCVFTGIAVLFSSVACYLSSRANKIAKESREKPNPYVSGFTYDISQLKIFTSEECKIKPCEILTDEMYRILKKDTISLKQPAFELEGYNPENYILVNLLPNSTAKERTILFHNLIRFEIKNNGTRIVKFEIIDSYSKFGGDHETWENLNKVNVVAHPKAEDDQKIVFYLDYAFRKNDNISVNQKRILDDYKEYKEKGIFKVHYLWNDSLHSDDYINFTDSAYHFRCIDIYGVTTDVIQRFTIDRENDGIFHIFDPIKFDNPAKAHEYMNRLKKEVLNLSFSTKWPYLRDDNAKI